MPENQPNIAVRSFKRLMTLAGISINKDEEVINSIADKLKGSGSISAAETNVLRNGASSNSSKPSVDQLKKELTSTSDLITSKQIDNKSYQAMVPEIGKAKTILIPSIMSPSDMYGEDLTISLKCPELNEPVSAAISTLLSDHINTELQLGIDVTSWISAALFDDGASSVMIIPRKIIKVLATSAAEISVESDDVIKPTTKFITSVVKPTLNSNTIISLHKDKRVDLSFEDLSDVFTELGATKELQTSDTASISKEAMDFIENNVDISVDYRKIATVGDGVKKAKAKTDDLMDGLVSKFGQDRIMHLTDTGEVLEDEEPLVFKLPASAVIPVHVPGSPSSHIGYFVLIDEFGNPIDNSVESVDNKDNETNPFLSGMDTMFSRHADKSAKKYNAMSMIFDITLQKTIDDSLEGIGLSSASVTKSDGIYSCIFNRAMRKNKVTLIYVPSEHMAYYAYEFREDGTGKGIMEDASYLIAMRTSFLIAKVIGAMDNATDRRKITFSLGENKGTNLEQIMETIRDAYLDKYMYNMEQNPMNVQRDIISRNLSIVPKEMAGVANLELDTETTQGDGSTGDTEMEEILTDLITLVTKVPAAALNDLGESEFSRSVATTNLLFANYIRSLQRITCRETGVLVKNITSNSYSLLKAITTILEESELDISDDVTMHKYINYIISNIIVTLPPPNVSPDKARYEELSDLIGTIEDTIEKLLPDELILIDDDMAKETISAIKADLIRKNVLNVISQLGLSSFAEIPDISELDNVNIVDINQTMLNFSSGIKQILSTMKPTNEDDDDY